MVIGDQSRGRHPPRFTRRRAGRESDARGKQEEADFELAALDASPVLRRALERRALRVPMKTSLFKQLKNEPGAEDGDLRHK